MAEPLAIILSPEAEADLDAIYEPVLSEVFRTLELFRHHPDLGQTMYAPFVGRRMIVVRMFRVIYRVTDQAVEIVYVRHCKRQLPKPI